MADMANIILSADGQSVELSDGYRFDGTEVRISRGGDRVVLESVTDIADQWSEEELQRAAREGLDSGPDEP